MTEAILSDMENKDVIARQIMDEWHKAVLENRIKDIMSDTEEDKRGEG